jgi:DNA gyrase subunit A
VIISRKGKALRTHEEAVRAMGRAGRGVRGMKLGDDDELAGILRVAKDETMLLLSEYGYGKRVSFDEYSSHGRGTGGQRIYTVTERTGEIVGCVTVREDEEIMVATSQGMSIKLKVNTIRVMGTSAQGVKIVSIEKPDFVTGVDRIVREDDDEKAPRVDAQPEDVVDGDNGDEGESQGEEAGGEETLPEEAEDEADEGDGGDQGELF